MAIQTVKYFSGDVELTGAHSMKKEKFMELFPGVKGKSYDYFYKWVGHGPDGSILPVTRIIYYKKNPSLHKCDSRCMCAKGGTCECSCGGKNHGIMRG